MKMNVTWAVLTEGNWFEWAMRGCQGGHLGYRDAAHAHTLSSHLLHLTV